MKHAKAQQKISIYRLTGLLLHSSRRWVARIALLNRRRLLGHWLGVRSYTVRIRREECMPACNMQLTRTVRNSLTEKDRQDSNNLTLRLRSVDIGVVRRWIHGLRELSVQLRSYAVQRKICKYRACLPTHEFP